jgi:hypothetical protein
LNDDENFLSCCFDYWLVFDDKKLSEFNIEVFSFSF